jgi:hypothetical protein
MRCPEVNKSRRDCGLIKRIEEPSLLLVVMLYGREAGESSHQKHNFVDNLD